MTIGNHTEGGQPTGLLGKFQAALLRDRGNVNAMGGNTADPLLREGARLMLHPFAWGAKLAAVIPRGKVLIPHSPNSAHSGFLHKTPGTSALPGFPLIQLPLLIQVLCQQPAQKSCKPLDKRKFSGNGYIAGIMPPYLLQQVACPVVRFALGQQAGAVFIGQMHIERHRPYQEGVPVNLLQSMRKVRPRYRAGRGTLFPQANRCDPKPL